MEIGEGRKVGECGLEKKGVWIFGEINFGNKWIGLFFLCLRLFDKIMVDVSGFKN